MDTIEEEPSNEKTTSTRDGDRVGAFSVHGPGRRHRRDNDDESVSTTACSDDDEDSTLYDVESAYCIRATVVTDAAEPIGSSSSSNAVNNSTMEVYEGRIVSEQRTQDSPANLKRPAPLLSRKVRILLGAVLVVVVTAVIVAGVMFAVHGHYFSSNSSANAVEATRQPPKGNGEMSYSNGGNDKQNEDPLFDDSGKISGQNNVPPSTGGGNGSGNNNGGQHRSNIRRLEQ